MKVALVVLGLIVACGGSDPDPHAVIDQNRPKLLELKKKLAALPGKLADAALPAENAVAFDPPLYLHRDYLSDSETKRYNLQVFEIGQLEHPEDSEFDATWPHDILGRAMSLEAKPPPKDKAKGKGTQMAMTSAFTNAFAIRYVAVVNITDWIPPRVTVEKNPVLAQNGGTYTPGSIKAKTFVLDLQSDKVIYGFETSAETPESVKFAYDWTKPETAGPAAEAAVQSTMKPVLADKVKRRLEILGDVRL